jgi:putative ABC transport system substrate-binding protein
MGYVGGLHRARKWVTAVSVLAAVAVASIAGAQGPSPLPRVGFLGMDAQMQEEWLIAFRDELQKLGYVDGRTITMEYRFAEGRFDRLPRLAAELVALKVDVIVTAAPPPILAAQRATQTIPIVMVTHDPVGRGFAAGLAHPGGNITGVAFQDAELSTKRLDLLRLAVPGLTRVAVIWNEAGGGITAVRAVEESGRALGLQVLPFEIKGPDDFAPAMAAARAAGVQGLVQLASPVITYNRARFIQLLGQYRLPATCELKRYVSEGCLMTYSASLPGMGRRLAYFVDRILRGANPADLPIEQPREFECVINLKTARALGLRLPQSLLVQADQPIE